MKVKIYTFPDKRPDFIEYQKSTIEKILNDHFYDDVNKNKKYFINEIEKYSKYNDLK